MITEERTVLCKPEFLWDDVISSGLQWVPVGWCMVVSVEKDSERRGEREVKTGNSSRFLTASFQQLQSPVQTHFKRSQLT